MLNYLKSMMKRELRLRDIRDLSRFELNQIGTELGLRPQLYGTKKDLAVKIIEVRKRK